MFYCEQLSSSWISYGANEIILKGIQINVSLSFSNHISKVTACANEQYVHLAFITRHMFQLLIRTDLYGVFLYMDGKTDLYRYGINYTIFKVYILIMFILWVIYGNHIRLSWTSNAKTFVIVIKLWTVKNASCKNASF